MVYYKSYGTPGGEFPSVDRAACVTDVKEVYLDTPSGVESATNEGLNSRFQVRLCVMNPEGLFFTDWLDQGQKGGQWDWMPFQKDQQARLAFGTANESHAGSTGKNLM